MRRKAVQSSIPGRMPPRLAKIPRSSRWFLPCLTRGVRRCGRFRPGRTMRRRSTQLPGSKRSGWSFRMEAARRSLHISLNAEPPVGNGSGCSRFPTRRALPQSPGSSTANGWRSPAMVGPAPCAPLLPSPRSSPVRALRAVTTAPNCPSLASSMALSRMARWECCSLPASPRLNRWAVWSNASGR